MSFFNFFGLCSHQQEEQPEIVVSSLRTVLKNSNEDNKDNFQVVGNSTVMIKKSKYYQYLENCKKNNTPFTDNQFPPNQQSLNFKIEGRTIVWKRISEIKKDAVMVQGQINPADIQQGNIGDCYFLASISALAGVPSRIQTIFYDNFQVNGFGIYKVVVNFEGVLTEVVIDDYIPVLSTSDRPVFCKPVGRQIWVMLIEKAWAKIKGSYGNISAGCPHEVLNTFSVAPCYYFQINELLSTQTQNTIWSYLELGCSLKLAICAGSKPDVTLGGIKPQHTYTILNCGEVTEEGKVHRILRLRNPWGETEYTGKGSEHDKKFWNHAPEEIRKKLMPPPDSDDGDFTIPFRKFMKHFESIDVSVAQPNFSYEFDILKIKRRDPIFITLQVKQQHEAFITIQKTLTNEQRKGQSNFLTNVGYSRMIIAQQIDIDTYQHRYSRIENNFPDLTISCPELKTGRYLIMIDADFPREQFVATFSYYYSTLQSPANKHYEILNEVSPSKYVSFMESVFRDYALRTIGDRTPLGSKPQDWVRTTFLFQQGGYGFVQCNLHADTPIKLQITIDKGVIEANGFELIGYYDSQQTVQAGQQKMILFSYQFASKAVENIQFPPPGFKISRIV